MSKKGEIVFEAKEARKQRKKRLSFDPLERKDQWWLWRTNLIKTWLSPKNSERVLDVGAASCEIADFMASQGSEVIAIDVSREMLAISKERMKQYLRKSDLNVVVADSENIPFRKNSFDKCLCWGVLHHMPDPKKALSEIYTIIKKEGTLMVAAEPNRFNIFRRIGEIGWMGENIESSFYPKKLRQLLESDGYKIQRTEYIYHRGMQNPHRSNETARPKNSLIQRTHRIQKIFGNHMSQKLGILFKYFFGEIFIKSKKPK